ncbi:DEAD/DEAH box helicase [Bacillus cereus]|uniref:DEAD/DEAH box helicase n=2 Tax=Bacillus cereus TaxID=1396 RepID=UPI000BEE095A|nr:DEAD/DEAH box helicase family protein [Bacillus cereus]MEB8796655.1 DEAD/DEAH box helicase family protein [Bacillus cereus]MEB8992818.1 DEAD/DEAH box helicase family protein [Bacillus cereus]PDY57531.1 restriction endonuclease subunit R [Bacillus cereus]
MREITVNLPRVVNACRLSDNMIYHTAKVYKKEKYSFSKENGIVCITNIKTNEKICLVNSRKLKIGLDNFPLILKVDYLNVDNDNFEEEIEKGEWIKHPNLMQGKISKYTLEMINNSWVNKLHVQGSKGGEGNKGLRAPQIGAFYAALSHWTLSNSAATIVLPTGTGKTETMLSVMIGAKVSKVLVIVPSDALREQISSKFISLGILPQFGIVGNIIYPIVGVLKKGIKGTEQLNQYFSSCNVIVTTMSLLAGFSKAQKEEISKLCSHLFIDEAHHIAANSWKDFKGYFKEKKILQFTATPFRNDGKYIDGEIIYNYPLAKAQKEGYFKAINFIPVEEYNELLSDQKIAEEAVRQLERDLTLGYDHIIMARVSSKKRADEIWGIYKQYKTFNPVKIYSSMNAGEKKEILQKIKNKKSRIIVCVNMLGEGFDLPQLKISALHDKHKSLGITLQFIGRFTRTAEGLGDATLIANIANENISNQIQELYQQDADWNKLIQQKSKETVDHRLSLDALANNFTGDKLDTLSIQELRPKTSTVVYMTKLPEWTPERLEERIFMLENTWVLKNVQKNILIVIEKREPTVTWSKTREIYNTMWESSIFYWNAEKNILFVNSSANEWLDNWVKDLIKEPIRVSSDSVFNSFYGIQRLQLNTIGLNEAVKGPLRYRMYTGIDISEALSPAEKRTSVKSNIFGIGYEDGQQVSVGASYKGKVWSKASSDINGWIKWCNKTGEKLTDKSIRVEDILKGVLMPSVENEIPELYPITVDWPVALFEVGYINSKLKFGNIKRSLFEIDIRFVKKENKKLYFSFITDGITSEYSMRIENSQVVYEHHKGPKIEISNSTRERYINILDYLNKNHIIFQYPDTSYLEGNVFVKVPKTEFIFDKDKIEVWNWSGTNIQKESQYVSKTNSIRKNSVQYKVIQTLKMSNKYSLIFDDDGRGEAADIIAIYEKEKTLFFEFYHCKYSGGTEAGSRVDDLYEVCGQANKSVDWRKNLLKIFSHIRHREKLRNKEQKKSRFEIGDHKELSILESKMKSYDLWLDVFIVQPGISKESLTNAQLNILASTEHYLKSTFKIGFTVISNK